MIIDCIADLHGNFPKLEGGDLLIIAGDLTANGRELEYFDCFDWIEAQNYRKKILIAGNHDMQMQEENYQGPIGDVKEAFEYLCDSGTEFEGFKIWGSPWSLWFKGINPHCTAFTGDEDDLDRKFSLIPQDIDILVTHSPPHGILDELDRGKKTKQTLHGGSKWLAFHSRRVRPKLHVFGHIHEGYGRTKIWYSKSGGTELVNASHVDVNYRPINKPVRVEL